MLIGLCIVIFLLMVSNALAFSFLLRRVDNSLARVLRLEQVEDRRHAYDKAMAEKASETIKLRCKPKEDCPKCHGKGHIGRNVETNLFIPCICCS